MKPNSHIEGIIFLCLSVYILTGILVDYIFYRLSREDRDEQNEVNNYVVSFWPIFLIILLWKVISFAVMDFISWLFRNRKNVLVEYAKIEMDILFKYMNNKNDKSLIEPFQKEILAIVKKFSKNGESGCSAPSTAKAISMAIYDLCLLEPLTPVMNTDEEWEEVTSLNTSLNRPIIFQNKRCSALFKEGKNGRPYYLDAIIWRNQYKETFTGEVISSLMGKKLWSRQYVKSFPYTPKTFFVNVTEIKVTDDMTSHYISDEKQLIEIFNYYDEYETE